MTAKQTTRSASLAVLCAAASPALADPGEPAADDATVQPPGEVQPQPPAPAPSPPPPKVELMPKRKPTGTFEIGAGYATDDGFMVGARIAQPRMFGSDKGLLLSAELTERHQVFLMRYEDPTLFDALHLRGDLYSHRKLYPGFLREAAGGELVLSRTIAPHLNVFAGYKLEHVEVTPDATSLYRGGAASPSPWRGGLVGAVRAGVAYSTIADPFYPRRGTSVGAAIEVADRDLGSDLQYVRTDSWFAHHRPLGPFTLHLAGRVRTITDVPLSERLHFDGSSDIRGYAPGAVGPRDPITGQPTGGNLLWTARAELEVPLVPSAGISVAGFADAGGVHAAWGGENAASVGYGLIWRSPIGPLRFDFAYPLDGGKPQFILGIGGLF